MGKGDETNLYLRLRLRVRYPTVAATVLNGKTTYVPYPIHHLEMDCFHVSA